LPEYFTRETGDKIKQQSLLNRVGIAFEEQQRYEAAIALFKLNIELFPGNGNLWESLGEGYLAKGDKARAMASYRKSLTMKPSEGCFWCANAKEQLIILSQE